MLHTARTPVVFLVAITLIAGTAFAAWNLTTNEYAGYQGTISTVRTNLATWTSGANSSTIGKATITLLKKADRRLARASARLSVPTTWKMVSRSLSALEDGAYYLQQAARLEKRNTTFLAFVAGAGSSLYVESNKLVVSATTYVTANFTSKRASRKILRAGGKNARAKTKATATRPRYHAAIRLNNKAIRILGRAGLL